jgi:NAD(P)-dependent dehydrogenase (short-subunit alcohol dehydrogenase family)
LNELPFEEWRKVLSSNLDGVFLTCQGVAREMIKQGPGRKDYRDLVGGGQGAAQGFGRILRQQDGRLDADEMHGA